MDNSNNSVTKDEPIICPCGFHGTLEKKGFCSVCYKTIFKEGEKREIEQREKEKESQMDLESIQDNATGDEESLTEEIRKEIDSAEKPSISKISKVDTSISSKSSCTLTTPDKTLIKSRCGICKARVPISTVCLGPCQCDAFFCPLHRLPEQHDCTFDYKNDGRRKDLAKIISPRKNMGNKVKRIDENQ
ncbi:AN1-type zinc finger protein 3 [Intoshia linei]|uniref:AN1-type zinc finger protein 3 n=1 Tax=Intoshia linei TaxID=1819745 RepID=A0A177B333_9BILA|nr:AN1-type zinc finger protein 3 [Intoshia linei]